MCYTLQTVGNRVRSKPIIHLPPILAACIGLLLFVSGSNATRAGEPPLVLAFYYAWYDQGTWTSGLPADQPAQPYASSDPATVERHVNQAQAAGIDALIQSWYGPQEANNQTETNFRMLLDVAAAKGFRAGADFETDGPFFPDQASVVDALRYLLTVHAQHPAYLRHAAKPVVFFWRQQRFSVDEWAAIRAQIDPNRDSLWIAEGVDIAYQAVFDGHHLYSIAWSPDVERTLADWGFRVRRYEADNDVERLWVATVMPAYDDTRTGRADAFSVDRQDGGYYRQAWSAAMGSKPDWIVITSFNEWVEGTMIEPSLTYGNQYLDLTRDLATRYKSESEPEPESKAQQESSVQQSEPELQQPQTPVPAEPHVRADEAVRVRAGPGTDYPRLGRLAPGEVAPVTGRNADGSWWQIEVAGAGDGLGWVIAEFVTLVGTSASVPVIEDVAMAATDVASTTAVITPTLTATHQPSHPTPSPTRAAPSLPETPTPMPTAPSAPTATLSPLREVSTATPVRSPDASPIPLITPELRTTPVAHRRPVALLWVGGGALATAFGLGVLLIQRIRSKR